MSTETQAPENQTAKRRLIPREFWLALIGVVFVALIVGIVKLVDKNVADQNLADLAKSKNDTIQQLKDDRAHISDQLVDMVNRLMSSEQARATERSNANLNTQQYQANLDRAQAAVSNTVDAMTALQKKQAADNGLIQTRIGQPQPTTVRDTVINSNTAKLTATIRVLRDSTKILTAALGQKNAQIKTLTDEVSDLEQVLNGDNGLSEVRTLVQDKRAAASKGLGKFLKAGQIKVLGQADSALAAQQNKRPSRIRAAKSRAGGTMK